jgi:hypothetical protein
MRSLLYEICICTFVFLTLGVYANEFNGTYELNRNDITCTDGKPVDFTQDPTMFIMTQVKLSPSAPNALQGRLVTTSMWLDHSGNLCKTSIRSTYKVNTATNLMRVNAAPIIREGLGCGDGDTHIITQELPLPNRRENPEQEVCRGSTRIDTWKRIQD